MAAAAPYVAHPPLEEAKANSAALARAVRLPVIASGGVAGVEDITALREADAGIEGAILGRALYDGRIEPKVALAAAE